jgi:hypothetical protein
MKCEHIGLLIAIYLLGSIVVLLGSGAVYIGVNPLNITNDRKTDKCERESEYFLYGWGIAGIILGSIVIFFGALENWIFVRDTLEDNLLPWMLNVSIALAIGFYFVFGSFVSAFFLFKHCVFYLRPYYWTPLCIVFSTSVSVLGIAFLLSMYFLCSSKVDDTS